MSTISTIRPKVRLILTAPNIDLINITAEHVRTLLIEQHGVRQTWARKNKKIVDELIWEIFFEVLSEKEELEHSSMQELLSALAGVQLASESGGDDSLRGSKMMETLTSALARARL